MSGHIENEPIDELITISVKNLLKRKISSTEIAQQTGITRQLIDNYRNNLSQLNKMSLRNIAPLYEYELRLAKEDEKTKRVYEVRLSRPTKEGVLEEPMATFTSLEDAENFAKSQIEGLPKVQEEFKERGKQSIQLGGQEKVITDWHLVIDYLIERHDELEFVGSRVLAVINENEIEVLDQ